MILLHCLKATWMVCREEEWCSKVAAQERVELLQSELDMVIVEKSKSVEQLEQLRGAHEATLAELVQLQTVATGLAKCEGVEKENNRLKLMLKTAEHEVENLRKQLASKQIAASAS